MPAKRAVRRTKEMDLRAGLAPASAVYDTAASLPMLAESEIYRSTQTARRRRKLSALSATSFKEMAES